jgi:ABC-type sulfate/molybdate transport systems ATPase subunit
MDLLAIDITLPRRSFDLRAELSLGGETLALVGPSGAGKTSLLRTVAGLERPTGGRIALGDEVWFDAVGRRHLSPERRRVGYLPQDYALFPHLTVAGNVRFAARRNRPDLLEMLAISHLADVRPARLSGGERQRAALARALARDPRVLLLDEPFGALDAITRQQVRTELAELLGRLSLPTLLVTHSFEDATTLAGQVGVLDRGQVVQLARPADLIASPASALVATLTGANVLDGTADPTPAGSTVRLAGGGQLQSSTAARGAVQICIQPWALELTEPETGQLTDTVLSVRPDRGSLVVRLSRFTVNTPASPDGVTPISEGSVVGLRAAPEDVRVLAATLGPPTDREATTPEGIQPGVGRDPAGASRGTVA